ncbi:hypothetical protein ACFQI7_35785 [Paenibacillus allorhizosphaerae]|uniref:Uncharacterized protein n=1 Tax=Paenibacillus allorhizosphaerae TaxID=2849866 RepID=A0ABM8VU49_9BACL|nr:hypothetical protein [Paenibacillus allorhizosphaerae]CAG7658622.1 hypothetical protein PAECIP111802_07101 [Paenibacillus allorhizosphaerae]
MMWKMRSGFMFIDNAFVPMGKLYETVNEQLTKEGKPALKVEDELTMMVVRA